MRRPWNIVNVPVYSLCTQLKGRLNMNICTYVSAISRKPKMYAVSIEKDSKTYYNLQMSSEAVLQVLSREQSELIRILGKRSGFKMDKHKYLDKKCFLQEWNNFQVLNEAAAYLLLGVKASYEVGDHQLFLFEVLRSKTIREDQILMFQDLIDDGLILS